MSIVILAISLAAADEPTAVVDGSVVRGSAHLAVPPERFLAELGDPTWESTISSSTTKVELKAKDGECQKVAYVSPNMVMEAVYEVRRCPTDDGWHSTLVSSNAFSSYSARWRAVAEDGGSRVTYEIDLTPSIWVPTSLVRSETRRSVLELMQALADWSKTQTR